MFILDTDFLVDLLKGREDAERKLKAIANQPLAVSAISIMELAYGELKRHGLFEDELLANYRQLPLTGREAKLASELRLELEKKGGRIGPEDEMIAATALLQDAKIITRNLKHFKRVKGLKLDTW